jgi:long-subunit acyl-CoA synthetase (AMP-forming)
MNYEALLSGAALRADLGLDENAPAASYTSGGASKPRGVLLSHRARAPRPLRGDCHGPARGDVSLCSVPFAYEQRRQPQVNFLAVGATSILSRRNDPRRCSA